MKKRLFLSIPISKELQKEAQKVQKRCKHIKARWLHGKNLHITTIPPWWEEDVDRIKKMLKTIEGKIKPFALKFDTLSFGPPILKPYMIWARCQTPPQLIKHKKSLETLLSKEPEARPFLPHITLARFKPHKQKETLELNEQIEWEQQVTHFALMQSHLSGTHAEYEILEELLI